MDDAFLIRTLLISVFFFGGLLLILLGILIWRRLWDSGSVEVDAECIDVREQTVVSGTGSDRTYFPNAKRPVYLYYYNEKQYTASPLLASNRPGYDPVFGCCKIRIDPKHPEKVYSPERKLAAQVLILNGTLWLIIASLCTAFLPV